MFDYKFTLENLTYSLVVNSNEDINIILPRKTPNDEVKPAAGKNDIDAVNDVNIQLYVKTELDPVPNIIFTGQSDQTKIITRGSFKLLPKSLMLITLSTIDGGLTWIVNSCNANEVTAEGAEAIAKNAQEIAVKATDTADTAKATADVATNTATTAKSVADEAKTASEEAKSTAKQALDNSADAVLSAEKAIAKATIAVQSAEDAGVTADTAVETANRAETTANNSLVVAGTAKDTAEQAVTKAENAVSTATESKRAAEAAKTEAEIAQAQAATAENKADNAQTTANDAQTTADNAVAKAEIAQASADASIKLHSDGYQTMDTGLVLANGRKFLLQRHSGGTPVGVFMGYYDTLTDQATGEGLEQVELGTTTTITCLNHCGAVYTDASGVTHTVDKHVRVDCKEVAGGPTFQEQIAYVSDVEQLQTVIDNQNTQITELNDKITEQDTKLNLQAEQITELETNINEQNTKLTEQASKITDLETKLTEQDTKLDEQATQITTLQADVADLKSKINTIIQHVVNAENMSFWIDTETYQPTRPNVDPDTLPQMVEY